MSKDLGQPEPSYTSARNHYYLLKSKLAEYALELKRPLAPTAWKNFIINLLTENNDTTRRLESEEKFPFENTLKNDLEVFIKLYRLDFSPIIERLETKETNIFNKEIFTASNNLSDALETGTSGEVLEALEAFIAKNGLGEYAFTKVFRANKEALNSEAPLLVPVTIKNLKKIDELVGYDRQKERLIQNTKSFISGNGGLNTLLYGDMGTGKSTMIKSLISLFDDTPLRLIELKKDEMRLMPEIYKAVADTNYPFILFIDDLSFDDGDVSYKEFKNVLEGSFEEPPENLVLYATSNKRTLVSQRKSERQDAVNAKEILEEKLSLVSRFGLTIQFSVPKQSDYLEIIKYLAEENNLEYDDEMRERAIQWEMRHMNRSGRTAEQFIQFLLTEDSVLDEI